MTTNHQLINQTSGKVEYYTPPAIIEAARATMGGIDLDPASSARANEIVQAARYFTVEDDGLNQPWAGRVWMNHPFGKGEKACRPNCKKKTCRDRGHCITEYVPGNNDWIQKLLYDFKYGAVEEAICITFASMSEAWLRPLLWYPMCFPYRRINYLNPDGTVVKGVPKGSVITYLGPNFKRFQEVFYLERRIGVVKS